MKKELPRNRMRKRSIRLSFILCIIGGLLLLRLMWVQIIEGHHYEEMALNQTEGVQTLYSPRGTIYDRNGRELAFSIMVKSFYADPGTMNVSPEEAAKELAPLLHQKEGDLVKDLSQDSRFVWLERVMDPEDSDKVIALIKETSILSVVGIVEVTRQGTLWASSSFLSFQAYFGVAVIYLIMTLTLASLGSFVERRLAQSDRV